MYRLISIFLFALLAIGGGANSFAATRQKADEVKVEPFNRQHLHPRAYAELPLGAIEAEGWLYEMLDRQRKGLTGNLDELYSHVMGERNGWLGGDGDVWERGPYWIDGLLPLAYILDDKDLKAKVQPWIEWALASQDEEGYFGPTKELPYEEGLQRNNARDWWPKMVMWNLLRL